MTPGLVSWLTAERHKYRVRCGPPTRDDMRACGVDLAKIRDYMRRAGWQSESKDTGDSRRIAHTGAVPHWLHPDLGAIDFAIPDTEILQELAKCEERTAWEILDDCAYYAGPREIWHEGLIVARVHGAEITIANNP